MLAFARGFCFFAASFYFWYHPLALLFFVMAGTWCVRQSVPARMRHGRVIELAFMTLLAVVTAAVLVPNDLVATEYVAFDNFQVERCWGMAREHGVVLLLGAAALGLALGSWRLPPRWDALVLVGQLTCFVAMAFTFDAGLFAFYGSPDPTHLPHDTARLLACFYRMKQGADYYTAWQASFVTPRLYLCREPTLAWLWATFLPADGRAILYAYVGWSVTGVVAAFVAVRRWSGPAAALACAQLMLALYFKGLYGLWATSHDLWVTPLLLMALACLAYEESVGAAICLTCAAMTRELMLIELLLFLGLLLWRRDRRGVMAAVCGLATFTAFYSLHLWRVAQKVVGPADNAASPEHGLHGGLLFLLKTMQFGGTLLAGQIFTVAVLVVTALYTALKPAETSLMRRYCGMIVAVFLIMFLFLGTQSDDYWGSLYLPAVFVAATTTSPRQHAES